MKRATGVAERSFRSHPKRGEWTMSKTLLALGALAVALTAAPAEAKKYTNISKCSKYRHGRCVAWKRMTVKQARRAGYNVGYRFGPRYAYTSYQTLPRVYVQRYDLSPNYRYVYRDNYIYQVDPRTYAITRIIDALTR
jgi:hypothetical protein